MSKLSPRAKFINTASLQKLAAYAWDAMQLASSHDPDHAKELNHLSNLIYAEVKLADRRFTDVCARVSILERQVERLGAPRVPHHPQGQKALNGLPGRPKGAREQIVL